MSTSIPTWCRLLSSVLLWDVLLGAEELFGCPVSVMRCREGALKGEPLTRFVAFDDPVPALRSGGVAAELDDIGITEAFGDQPSAPG